MKEKDDIANTVNNTEVESFDIKQEWLDDMSSQLDAYNLKKSTAKYWWSLLALIPILAGIIAFLPDSKESEDLATINAVVKNELVDKVNDKKATAKSQKNNTIGFNSQDILTEDETATAASSELDALLVLETEKPSMADHSSIETPLEKVADRTSNASSTEKNTRPTIPSRKTSPETSQGKQLNSDDQPASNSPYDVRDHTNDVENNKSQSEIVSKPSNKPEEKQKKESSNTARSETTETPIETIVNPSLTESNQPIVELETNHSTAETPIINQAEENSVEENSSTEPESNTITTTETENTASETAAVNSEQNNKSEEESTRISADGEKPKLWSIGITVGPDLLEKETISTEDGLLNFEQKKKEELFDNTWGFDFELNRRITPWLTLGTGIGYKKYQEVNSYSSDTFITIDTSYRITDISFMYIDSTITDSVLIPNFLTVTDIIKDTIVDSSKQAANGTVTSSYIQIPINAQLTFIRTKKFRAYTNLGLNLGLLTKTSGVVLDYTSNDIVNFNTRKMIYNANIGLGLNYNIFGPLDYKVYAAYSRNLSNFSLQPNIQKHYHGFNFRTGLVFRF
ncbi:MAG: outer membrane beta-barrel protein [Crocinitomicaceae bacterium]